MQHVCNMFEAESWIVWYDQFFKKSISEGNKDKYILKNTQIGHVTLKKEQCNILFSSFYKVHIENI